KGGDCMQQVQPRSTFTGESSEATAAAPDGGGTAPSGDYGSAWRFGASSPSSDAVEGAGAAGNAAGRMVGTEFGPAGQAILGAFGKELGEAAAQMIGDMIPSEVMIPDGSAADNGSAVTGGVSAGTEAGYTRYDNNTSGSNSSESPTLVLQDPNQAYGTAGGAS